VQCDASSDEPKTQTEIKELEAKKAEMAAYFRQYESMRYCKTLQAFCAVSPVSPCQESFELLMLRLMQVMNTQQAYHSAVLAKLEAANTQWQAAVAARPPPLPADTWSTCMLRLDVPVNSVAYPLDRPGGEGESQPHACPRGRRLRSAWRRSYCRAVERLQGPLGGCPAA
jgi:hypothetical protein